jgi:15-cis-phytoene synthase
MKNNLLIGSPPTSLHASYKTAETITKNYAKTFYFASQLLPKSRRKHAYAIYAFCRTADSLVDDAEKECSPEAIQRHLEELRRFIYEPQGFAQKYPWGAAFQQTMQNLHMPSYLFEELLNGVEMDLHQKRYASFEELYLYCYRVAGVVGQMMCYVYGLTDAESLHYAEKLGVAMQLTNILRDVREDWERERLYIPQEDLLRFGVKESEIAAGQDTSAYRALMKYEIERARAYYREAVPGIRRIPSLPLRLTTIAMARLYEGILDKLEANPAHNLSQRAALSQREKYLLAGQTFLGLTPIGTKPLPPAYRLAVGCLLLLTPFALADAVAGAFSWMAGLSDSLYLLLWGGVGAYAIAAHLPKALRAWGLSVLLGYAIELIGTQTGYPFGPYQYTAVLQPQLMGVPLAIAMAWGSLVGLWALLGPTQHHWRALWTAAGAIATDLLLEPYATTLRHYWHWQTPEIPLTNYLSWGVFAAWLSLLYPLRHSDSRPYPDVVSRLGRGLLLLLAMLLLTANLAHGSQVGISLIAAGALLLMLLWPRI